MIQFGLKLEKLDGFVLIALGLAFKNESDDEIIMGAICSCCCCVYTGLIMFEFESKFESESKLLLMLLLFVDELFNESGLVVSDKNSAPFITELLSSPRPITLALFLLIKLA